MSQERDFLKEHAGFCCWPLVETGRKTLCNAMTFQVNGKFPPLCEQHLKELRQILEHRKALSVKKKSFKATGGV